jgi:hypothetical protein
MARGTQNVEEILQSRRQTPKNLLNFQKGIICDEMVYLLNPRERLQKAQTGECRKGKRGGCPLVS